MEKKYSKIYSRFLDREMPMIQYGTTGKPCLVIPSQDGQCGDFEGFGMVDACGKWIEEGRLQLFCIDTIDKETWSNQNGDPKYRIELHEKWIQYILEEVYPILKGASGEKPMVMGCSLGAMHAGNLILRFPELFDTSICMSGAYDATTLLGGYMDDLVYLNSPYHSLKGMPYNHEYIKKYNLNRMIFCVGQGAWEDELLSDTRKLDEVMKEKGIHAWFDYWGYDVSHDWCWWQKQVAYFLGNIL